MPDRATFFKEAASTLDFLLMHPASQAQKYVTLVVAVLVLIFFLSKFHKWGRAARSGFLISLAAAGVSVFFLFVVAVCAQRGIAELGLVKNQEIAGLAIVLGIAFFSGVVPWTRFCFKAAYFTSVAAWILTGCFVAGALHFSQPIWKAADNAGQSVEKAAEAAKKKTESATE